MKWQDDLIKDIRFGDDRDDLDGNYGRFPEVPDYSISVKHPATGVDQTMSQCNVDAIVDHLKKLPACKCILEIGVDCNGTPTEMTSTRTFLDNKLLETIYLGIDIADKSYLNNPELNIFTLQMDAANIDQVMEFAKSKGVTEIDFLFIDGWHSINQVMQEWEYTRFLSPGGIVGFHDTAIHPGPTMFVKYLDRSKWDVMKNSCSVANDYGIVFAWRKA